MALRVLVDSGPAQRELFAIHVSADEPVEAIRSAIAQHTGISSMSLFKVSCGNPASVFHPPSKSSFQQPGRLMCRACTTLR